MKEPLWISEQVALAIHGRQIAEHGGEDGIRDASLLTSALARLRNVFAYEGESTALARLAAAYLVGISKNHPFVDGNKRVAAVACETFLNQNALDLDASDEELYDLVLAIASSEMEEDMVAEWFRLRIRAR